MLLIGAADVFILPTNEAVFCRSLRLLALFHHSNHCIDPNTADEALRTAKPWAMEAVTRIGDRHSRTRTG